jgi:hypothetical protein
MNYNTDFRKPMSWKQRTRFVIQKIRGFLVRIGLIKIKLPAVYKSFPVINANDIVNVQPMTIPPPVIFSKND